MQARPRGAAARSGRNRRDRVPSMARTKTAMLRAQLRALAGRLSQLPLDAAAEGLIALEHPWTSCQRAACPTGADRRGV